MGRQTIVFAMGISGISATLGLLGMCLPLHRIWFVGLGALKVGELHMYSIAAKLDISGNDFCVAIRRFAPGQQDFCETAVGFHDLQDMSQRFCAPAIKILFRGACEGMTAAYALGITSIIFMIVNFVLEGLAVWMMYYYTYKSPKKKFRSVAFILIAVGTSAVALVLGMYLPLVSFRLDDIRMSFGSNFIFSVSNNGMGIALGYWLLWLSVLVQVVQIVLLKYSKLSEERRLIELKMQEQFEAELAVAEGGYGSAYDHYGGEYYGEMGAAQYGTDPYGNGYGQQTPAAWGQQSYASQGGGYWSTPPPSLPAYGFGGAPPPSLPAYGFGGAPPPSQPAYGFGGTSPPSQPAYGLGGYPAY